MNQPDQENRGLWRGALVGLAALSVTGWLATRGERHESAADTGASPEPVPAEISSPHKSPFSGISFRRAQLGIPNTAAVPEAESSALEKVPYINGQQSNGIDTNAFLSLKLHSKAVDFLVQAGETYNSILGLRASMNQDDAAIQREASAALRTTLTNFIGQIGEFEKASTAQPEIRAGIEGLSMQFSRFELSASVRLLDMGQRLYSDTVNAFERSKGEGSMSDELHDQMYRMQQRALAEERGQADSALSKIDRMLQRAFVLPRLEREFSANGFVPQGQ